LQKSLKTSGTGAEALIRNRKYNRLLEYDNDDDDDDDEDDDDCQEWGRKRQVTSKGTFFYAAIWDRLNSPRHVTGSLC
jgi:hypothetical protein